MSRLQYNSAKDTDIGIVAVVVLVGLLLVLPREPNTP